MSVAIYLGAIVLANLLVVWFGPAITVLNAFLFVGLDLTLRDRLHDRWSGDRLALRMLALIAAGGALSYLLNRDAAQIALASVAAFALSAVADGLVYHLARGRSRLVRVNASNVVGAAVDSVLFPTLAFGAFMPVIVLGQFAAKTLGGLAWSLILAVPLRSRSR